MGRVRGDDLDGGVTSQRRRDPGRMWKKLEEGWAERLFWGFLHEADAVPHVSVPVGIYINSKRYQNAPTLWKVPEGHRRRIV